MIYKIVIDFSFYRLDVDIVRLNDGQISYKYKNTEKNNLQGVIVDGKK